MRSPERRIQRLAEIIRRERPRPKACEICGETPSHSDRCPRRKKAAPVPMRGVRVYLPRRSRIAQYLGSDPFGDHLSSPWQADS